MLVAPLIEQPELSERSIDAVRCGPLLVPRSLDSLLGEDSLFEDDHAASVLQWPARCSPALGSPVGGTASPFRPHVRVSMPTYHSSGGLVATPSSAPVIIASSTNRLSVRARIRAASLLVADATIGLMTDATGVWRHREGVGRHRAESVEAPENVEELSRIHQPLNMQEFASSRPNLAALVHPTPPHPTSLTQYHTTQNHAVTPSIV